MNTYSFTVHYKNISACTKVLVEILNILYGKPCFVSVLVPWWTMSMILMNRVVVYTIFNVKCQHEQRVLVLLVTLASQCKQI